MSVPLYYISQHIRLNVINEGLEQSLFTLAQLLRCIWCGSETNAGQWCSGNFGAEGTLGCLGRTPQRGQGRVRGRGSCPLPKPKAFCFWISQEGIFTSPQNFVNFVNHTYFKWCRTNRIQWFTMMQLFTSAYQLGGPNQIFVWHCVIPILNS